MKRKIRKFLEENKNGDYSHLLLCLDLDDYECFLRPIRYDENVIDVIKFFNKHRVNIHAVYNCNLDLTDQLIEDNPYHIEPINKNENSKIKEALEFATKVHRNQKRINGTPYINHPIRVAENVKKYVQEKNMDELVISAYLHDTLEDGFITYDDIANKFGYKIANIVLELTNDVSLKNKLGKTRYLQLKMKKMNNDALSVKLCDRLDNVRDLINADETFKYKYLEETNNIINYILKNRKLSEIHITLISEIKNVMLKYRKENKKLKIKKYLCSLN